VFRRRSGAAGFMAKVAPVNRQAGVHLQGPPLHHTIAMQGSQIGWQAGQWPKRIGVATMQGKAVLQQQEGAPELDLSDRLG